MSQSVGSERVSMELMGSATWPVGWDHDLGGVFSGRAMREAAEIQILTPDHVPFVYKESSQPPDLAAYKIPPWTPCILWILLRYR